MRPDNYAVSISYILLMPFHHSTGDRRNRKAWRVLDGTTGPNEGVRTLSTRGGVIQLVNACLSVAFAPALVEEGFGKVV